jgi:hypothetical protein
VESPAHQGSFIYLSVFLPVHYPVVKIKCFYCSTIGMQIQESYPAGMLQCPEVLKAQYPYPKNPDEFFRRE